MTRRFVFVPIFGDTTNDHPDAWLKAPHVKAWGFLGDEAPGNHGGEFIPIHTDPLCTAIVLGEKTNLFENEGKAAVDVDEKGELPEAVCIALMKLALVPEQLGGLTDDVATA